MVSHVFDLVAQNPSICVKGPHHLAPRCFSAKSAVSVSPPALANIALLYIILETLKNVVLFFSWTSSMQSSFRGEHLCTVQPVYMDNCISDRQLCVGLQSPLTG